MPFRRPPARAHGNNLGIGKGGTHPWMMFIDTDAVRVYRLK